LCNNAPTVRNVDYKEGDKVEVCSKEERFVGSHFEATVVLCLENVKYIIFLSEIFPLEKNHNFNIFFILKA